MLKRIGLGIALIGSFIELVEAIAALRRESRIPDPLLVLPKRNDVKKGN
ncbi:Uncharacterised protein [Mycobacteroides abscessus subsp. abscessus]|nr:Uncharacterised protein [Mycobacteroides abscessus subsp. abscessus]